MVATPRKVRDYDDARALLDAWSESGLSFTAFCKQKGVNGRSLHIWRVNLDRWAPQASHQEPKLDLVELTLAAPSARAKYRIEIDGAVIEVDDQFQEQTLARLLGVLTRC